MSRLTILMYHRVDAIPRDTRHPKNFVTPARFAEQIEALLSWGYEPITFAQWMAYRGRAASVPRKPFIVTFDDGYVDFATNAWPVLKRLNVPATVFVVAGKLGRTNDWDAGEPQTPLLDAGAIRALEAEGVEFGGHGFTHAALARISPNEAREEIGRCHGALAGLLSRPPAVFAYPYSNQSAKVRRLTREAGFACAVRGKGRLNWRWTDPFGLRRILMHEGVEANDLSRLLRRLRWTVT
ncbi:MAG TPA: polysaccharide deacetylase family protein [Gemmatimonadaceae bacterium]|nr:polysaccharide deacetylase family protein [Gemmatimonadaceae bacterium]